MDCSPHKEFHFSEGKKTLPVHFFCTNSLTGLSFHYSGHFINSKYKQSEMHGFVARAKQKDNVWFYSPDHLKSVGLFSLFRDVTETHEQIKHQSTTLSSCHVVLLFILLVTQRRRSDSAKYNLVLDMSSLLHSSINT